PQRQTLDRYPVVSIRPGELQGILRREYEELVAALSELGHQHGSENLGSPDIRPEELRPHDHSHSGSIRGCRSRRQGDPLAWTTPCDLLDCLVERRAGATRAI